MALAWICLPRAAYFAVFPVGRDTAGTRGPSSRWYRPHSIACVATREAWPGAVNSRQASMESSCQSRSRRVPSPGSLVRPNLGTSNASSFFVHSPHRDERHLNLIMRDAPIQVRIDLRDFIRPRKNPPRGEPDCAYL